MKTSFGTFGGVEIGSLVMLCKLEMKQKIRKKLSCHSWGSAVPPGLIWLVARAVVEYLMV